MREHLHRLVQDVRGNVLVLTGAGIFALIGGGGLGVDTVHWFLWKRQIQQAVDSGALAGAHALGQGANATAQATAELTRTSNRPFIIERLTTPPSAGAFTGDNRAVELVASTSARLPFSSMFLGTAPLVRARSVATSLRVGDNCVIALAGSGVGVNVPGGARVELGCGIAANSTGTQAVLLEGSSVTQANPLSAAGGIVAGPANISGQTSVQAYGPAQINPLAARPLQVPTSPSGCTATAFEAPPNAATALGPGRYCSGLALKGNVTLAAGVYIIDQGSFSISSQATVTGTGVTIVLTGSSPDNIATAYLAGGARVDLDAPTAAQDAYWKNILIYQDPRASERLSEFAGDSHLDMQGIIYMPGGNVRFAGSSGQSTECVRIVANRVTLAGNTRFRNNCPPGNDDDFSARSVRVVE
jgi:Flp pilus assembly protein TadG